MELGVERELDNKNQSKDWKETHLTKLDTVCSAIGLVECNTCARTYLSSVDIICVRSCAGVTTRVLDVVDKLRSGIILKDFPSHSSKFTWFTPQCEHVKVTEYRVKIEAWLLTMVSKQDKIESLITISSLPLIRDRWSDLGPCARQKFHDFRNNCTENAVLLPGRALKSNLTFLFAPTQSQGEGILCVCLCWLLFKRIMKNEF